MTKYSDVVSAFESIIKNKYPLADGLVHQWFLNALAEYELNIGELGFNDASEEFISPSKNNESFDLNGNVKRHIILHLAEIMKSYYMQQEIRRVNQLNNIIGKDISLNGTGDTKKYTKEESDMLDYKIADLYTKQKPPAYV